MMRSEREMRSIILEMAESDDRIRSVILNGSRANPHAPRDPFQDFDTVYIVTDVESFRRDPEWIRRFGEIMILQTPEDMHSPPPAKDGSYAYLVQFMDGNRLDLTLYPISRLDTMHRASLSILLLDKDGLLEPFPPPSECDYLPEPPTAKAFADCCNEFWWICTYVAKGLWREQLVYARHMLEQIARDQLEQVLTWHVGVQTRFRISLGSYGKNLEQHLEPELWDMLLETYSDACYDHTWDALFAMCDLFRRVARPTAAELGFTYPFGDDERVSAHLSHVRSLPKTAKRIS